MLAAATIQLTPTQLAWERTLDAVTVERVAFLEDAEHDRHLQQAAMERCELDPLFYFDNFCYATDPRRPDLGLDADTVFVPFDDQRVMFMALVLGYSLAIDKSRDTGASFVLAFFYAWAMRFRPGTTWGMTSKTGSDVDDGTPNSLLGKVVYALEHLPWWMQPDWRVVHSPHGQITNRDNGARVITRRTVADVWHNLRCSAVGFDEIARTPNAQRMVSGAKGTTNQNIMITTPNGSTGWWAELMRGESEEEVVELDPVAVMAGVRPDGDVYYHMQLSWMQDPRYDEAWAEDKKRGMSLREWLINYMCSYAASTSGLIWHQFVRQTHLLTDDDWQEFLRDYLDDADIYEAWDNGLYSSVVWSAHIKAHDVMIVLGGISWFEAGTRVIASDVSKYRAAWCPTGIRTKANPMGILPKVRVGDPAIRKKSELNLRTFIQDLRDQGIVLGAPATLKGKTKMMRDNIGDALEDCRLFFSPLCTQRWGKLPSIVDAVEQYHLLYRPGDNDPEPDKDHPSSHPADCLLYLGLTAWPKGKPAGIYRSRNGKLERVDPTRADDVERRGGRNWSLGEDREHHGFDSLEV